MIIIRAIGAAALAAVLAVPGFAAEADGDGAKSETACIRNHDIRGFGEAGEDYVVLSSRRGGRYKVELSGACPHLDDAMSVSIETTARMSCVQAGDRLTYSDLGIGPMTCFVKDVVLLEPDRNPID